MERNSKLAAHMRKNLGRGMIQGRKKDANEPFSTWHRDLAHCLVLLFREAQDGTTAALHALYEGNDDLKESMEAVDTIVQMLMKIYSDSYQNNLIGIANFGELYDYLDTPIKNEAYATFCAHFVQTTWLYMFTSGEMAMGLPKDINNDVLEYHTTMNILSVLDDKLRKKVLAQLVDKGIIPTTVEYSKLKRNMEPFLEVIKEDQRIRYERQAKRGKSGSAEASGSTGEKA